MASATARIEVFRPGTFKPMSGPELSYSAADLKAVADNYDAATAPTPIVIGHPATDAPAYGWVQSFDFDAEAERLYANIGEIEPEFAEAVKSGRYKKISLSFFRPEQAANPVPGAWYPKHVGFLGGAAPAVSGLKNVAFSAEAVKDAPVFTTSFGAGDTAASLFRSLRDALIGRWGLDDADKALPSFQIEWLGQSDDPALQSFAAPDLPQQKGNPLSDPDPKRAAALDTREAGIAAREKALAHTDNVNFADGLVTFGQLLAVSKDKVVALLDALPDDAAAATVSFAAGEADLTPAAALREILKAQPKVVDFSEQNVDPPAAAVAFAADGKQVDAESLERLGKAMDYQKAHPGTDLLTAVKAVS